MPYGVATQGDLKANYPKKLRDKVVAAFRQASDRTKALRSIAPPQKGRDEKIVIAIGLMLNSMDRMKEFSIGDIALAVGGIPRREFRARFKAETGMTPSQYRKEAKERLRGRAGELDR